MFRTLASLGSDHLWRDPGATHSTRPRSSPHSPTARRRRSSPMRIMPVRRLAHMLARHSSLSCANISDPRNWVIVFKASPLVWVIVFILLWTRHLHLRWKRTPHPPPIGPLAS